MVLSRFQLGFNRSRKSWSVVSGHLLPGFSEAKGCCGEAHQTGATCEVTKVTEVTGVTKAKMWISTLGNGNIGKPKQTLWSSPLADLDVSKAWLKPFDPALHSSCVFVNHTRPCDILWQVCQGQLIVNVRFNLWFIWAGNGQSPKHLAPANKRGLQCAIKVN